MIRLKHPTWLHVKGDRRVYLGFDQAWYTSFWRKKMGSAPTCATAQLIYLNKRDDLGLPYKNEDFQTVVDCMNAIWSYVTPLLGPIHSLHRYEFGVSKAVKSSKMRLYHHRLRVRKDKAVPLADVINFVQDGLRMDSPIAFLSSHSGDIRALQYSHWVIIVAIEGDIVTCYDHGREIIFHLGDWLKSTKKGGGFVYFETLKSRE